MRRLLWLHVSICRFGLSNATATEPLAEATCKGPDLGAFVVDRQVRVQQNCQRFPLRVRGVFVHYEPRAHKVLYCMSNGDESFALLAGAAAAQSDLVWGSLVFM